MFYVNCDAEVFPLDEVEAEEICDTESSPVW